MTYPCPISWHLSSTHQPPIQHSWATEQQHTTTMYPALIPRARHVTLATHSLTHTVTSECLVCDRRSIRTRSKVCCKVRSSTHIKNSGDTWREGRALRVRKGRGDPSNQNPPLGKRGKESLDEPCILTQCLQWHIWDIT